MTTTTSHVLNFVIDISFKDPCSYTPTQFVWKASQTYSDFQNLVDVRRDYLTLDVPEISMINAFRTIDGSKLYEDEASNGCRIEPVVWQMLHEEKKVVDQS